MPIGQLVIFAVWLALAMAGGALLVLVWERLRVKYSQTEQSGVGD
jgi:tryptophan-rich sensory protein